MGAGKGSVWGKAVVSWRVYWFLCVCVCVLSVEWEAYYRPIRPSSDVRFLRHCDACMYCRSTN